MESDDSDLQLLKAQIRRLNFDLKKKNHEINVYLEKIHDNEEEIMELQEIISKATYEHDFQKIIDSKINFEMKEKEREIRDLKNRMGFLRQEKTIAQKELEEFKMISKSTALSVEQIRKEEILNQDLLNLETLTNELRRKLYMQEILNGNLKDEIAEKEREINNLNLLVNELKQRLKVQNSILEGKFYKEKIKKELDKNLQKELNESKEQIEILRDQLTKFKEPERNKIKYEIEITSLKNEIIYLKEELDRKDKISNRLK